MSFTPISGTTTTKPTSSFTPITNDTSPAPTVAQPSLFSKVTNFLTSNPISTSIANQFDAGQQQIDQPFIDKGTSGSFTPLQAAEGALSVGAGVLTKVTAPLAPIFDQISKAVSAAGNALSNTPYLQGYGKDLATQAPGQNNTPERILTDIINAANAGMAILGGAEGLKGKAEVPAEVPTELAPRETPTVGNEIKPPTNPFTPSEALPTPTASPVIPETPELLNAEAPKRTESTPTEAPQTRQLPVASEAPTAAPEIAPPLKPSTAPVATPEAPTATAIPKTADVPPASTDTFRTPVKEPAATLPDNLTGTSKIGKSIEAKAVEAKLTQGFDQTAGYDKITIKDQAERATNLINNSLEDARAVVRGDKPLPDGLRGSALVTAMEQHLVDHPNADIAYELANSPHVSGTSAAAQEMRLAAERTPDSITAKFKEIKAAREAALGRRGGLKKQTAKVKSDIQKEITKTASKRPTWEEFTKQLTCQI